MSKFKVISRDAASVRYEGAPQYSGTYLGVDYIEFKNISSPTLIDWQIGDYVDYYRTGIRYKLYTLPMPKKVARVGSYGGAIEYNNVQFFAPTKDLGIVLFRDLVFDDNGVHFSTRQDVSTTEDVRGIARRIQACMDDFSPNRWRIEVYDTDDEDLNSLLSEKKEFSVSQGTCLDALSQIYESWKGVGWTHYTDKENDQEVIVIGRANVRDSDNTTDLFTYGIGNGLTSIRKNAANEGEFATRLYIYGSERNLPPRYYNQFDILNKESADIPNLMIPISEWGLTDGIPDPSKAYLQAEDALIEKYGLIPKTLYFDGSENTEIYPSIEGLTMSQVRQAMIELGQENEYLPEDINTRIDTIRGTFAEGDGSIDDYRDSPNIIIYINSVGFNIVEQGKKTSEGVATISIKSGKCAGRELRVKNFVGYQEGDNGIIWMAYEVERAWDESTAMAYPNSIYSLNAGDEFVLLGIPLPEYYISINSKKLLEQGKKMLADYTRVSAFYEPEVNAIRMKEIGSVITPGMYMKVKDDDIIETEDHVDYVLIDSLSIDEITEIPTYKITLREEKRSARTYSVLEDMIEDAKEDANKAIKRERQYTDRRFRSSEETLKMLESAFSNFSKGITPATVKTMALLIGDESLQYKFTSSRESLEDVPCPLSWSAETKQMVGVPASLIHMTLEVESIVPGGTRGASDYKSWNVVSWWDKDTFDSPFLEDADKSYYVYVRASKDSDNAWFFIDEKDHSMIEDDYYFLVGVLNSEYDGKRDFVVLYGFTEILPGQISTDVIRSSDGKTYFDLVKGEIGGVIKFSAGSSGLENIDGLTEAIQNSVGGLEFGKYNLLRNSGFTGDFVTESLDNKTILDKDSQMFSDPLTHWTASNVSVQDSEVGQSGKEVILSNGILSQTLKDKVIVGENYVLTFRAKGQRLSYSIGGVSGSENLSSEWQKYIIKFKAESSESVFSISNATAIICDLQLERGTVQSAWGHSMYDNQSELAKYQALAYLESAIKDGSSTVQGGLILSNLIMLGNVGKQDNTAGVSGIYNNDDDVAFWGGGTWQQAIQTAIRYAENPLYKPTDKEMSSLAKFIITHGGRAILNEAVVRGKVYADSGNIGGFEITRNRIGHANNGLSLSTSYLSFRDTDDDTSASRFSAIGENVLPSTMGIYGLSRFEIESSDSFDKSYGSAVGVYSSIKGYKKPYAYYCPNGQFAGLRPRFRRVVLPANELIEKIDHTIEVFGTNAAEGTLTLPTGPEDGQCYEIWKWGSCALTIKAQDTNVVRLGVSANPTQGIGTDFVGMVKIIFSKEAYNQWLMTLCRTE